MRPYPDVGKWQVSTGGGCDPKWALHGRELYFQGPRSLTMSSFEADPAVRFQRPVEIFENAQFS